MKQKILSGIKIYACCILYVMLSAFLYSFYLMKTNHDSNRVFELILGITTFLLLGLLYANMIHKRGLFVGLGTGIIHIFLIYFIYFLSTGNFQLQIFPIIIYILSSSLGGVLGITFKKIV